MARILVANDSPDLLDCCRSALVEEGHVVETVANGREAVRLAREWQPDLVVIDWVMPEIDGPTAIAALRRDPLTSSLPILLMSGSEDGEAAAAECGADLFLRKPFELTALVTRADELLRGESRPRMVHRRSSRAER
jgi:DNA-binding response OmpR family regulator